MAKAPKPTPPVIKVPFRTLIGLLGKTLKDPTVQAVLAKAGKVSFSSDFIVAKEAGFDYSLSAPEDAKTRAPKLLSSLFLYPEGQDRHRGYADLPRGFAFTTRARLLASLPPPESSWKLGKGKVPVSTADVMHDVWKSDGASIAAVYSGEERRVRHFNVKLPEEATGGRDFSTYPLHFETKPPDAPPDAERVGMALLVAWAVDRFGLPAKHARSEFGKQLAARKITPHAFLTQACNGRLTSLDFVPKLGDFLYEYLNHVISDDGARAKADASIAKLLNLEDPERRAYTDDFLGTFAKAVKSPFYVPGSWQAVDRIAPVIDARLADFEATGYLAPPKLELYQKAAKLRDEHSVAPARELAAKRSVDDALAGDLVALVGKSLKDKHVRDVLTRAGLPIGKRIDQQANPALGVAYMGAKLDIGGKRELGVDAVYFFASKQKSYIRGIGAEVEFIGYPGRLPRGLVFGETRQAVAKKLGKPKSSYESTDYWRPSKKLQMSCEFSRGKLVEVYFGQSTHH